MKKLIYIALLSLAFFSCGKEDGPDNTPPVETPVNWRAAADSSSTALTRSFWNAANKYFYYDSNGKHDFHYWPQAHALDVWVDAYLRTGDNTYKAYFDQWFEGVKAKNGNTFDNHFYDDMEWIALALLRVYDATQDAKYKDAALEVWGYIKTGWSETAGGGIFWNKDRNGKNACSNGPASILAARLYQRFKNEDDKQWALKIYEWEKSVLFNTNTGAVSDNIDIATGVVNKDWVFTYNQGTFVGAAVELHQILGEKAYLNDAVLAANYTIGTLVSNSILKSEGTGDGGLFKGIFIRYFTELIRQERLDEGDKRKYLQFMKYNAETLWLQGTAKPSVFFGPDWRNKPSSGTGLTEQLSGCMLVEAMAVLEKDGLLK